MPSATIVALPSEDEPVWEYSSEKKPHMTLLHLDTPLGTNIEEIVRHVQHTASISLGRFGLSVDRRGPLGLENADVLFFDMEHSGGKLREFRGQLLKNDQIQKSYLADNKQFPGWVPHLTMGYPETPAKDVPKDKRYDLKWINFDRIAVWVDDYEGPEFTLKSQDMVEDSAGYWSEDFGVYLKHYGREGMRWGARKESLDGLAHVDTDNGGVLVVPGPKKTRRQDLTDLNEVAEKVSTSLLHADSPYREGGPMDRLRVKYEAASGSRERKQADYDKEASQVLTEYVRHDLPEGLDAVVDVVGDSSFLYVGVAGSLHTVEHSAPTFVRVPLTHTISEDGYIVDLSDDISHVDYPVELYEAIFHAGLGDAIDKIKKAGGSFDESKVKRDARGQFSKQASFDDEQLDALNDLSPEDLKGVAAFNPQLVAAWYVREIARSASGNNSQSRRSGGGNIPDGRSVRFDYDKTLETPIDREIKKVARKIEPKLEKKLDKIGRGFDKWFNKPNSSLRQSVDDLTDTLQHSSGDLHVAIEEFFDALEHFGVKGMRWGVRRDAKKLGGTAAYAKAKVRDDAWAAKVEANPKLGKVSAKAARQAKRLTKKLKKDYKDQGINLKKDALARSRYDTELKNILQNSLDKAAYKVHKNSPSGLSEVAIHRHPDGSITAIVQPRHNAKLVKQKGKIAKRDARTAKREEKDALRQDALFDLVGDILHAELESADGLYDGLKFILEADDEGYVDDISVEGDDLSQSDEELDDELAHFGVKGMKWGVRNDVIGVKNMTNPSNSAAAVVKEGTSKPVSVKELSKVRTAMAKVEDRIWDDIDGPFKPGGSMSKLNAEWSKKDFTDPKMKEAYNKEASRVFTEEAQKVSPVGVSAQVRVIGTDAHLVMGDKDRVDEFVRDALKHGDDLEVRKYALEIKSGLIVGKKVMHSDLSSLDDTLAHFGIGDAIDKAKKVKKDFSESDVVRDARGQFSKVAGGAKDAVELTVNEAGELVDSTGKVLASGAKAVQEFLDKAFAVKTTTRGTGGFSQLPEKPVILIDGTKYTPGEKLGRKDNFNPKAKLDTSQVVTPEGKKKDDKERRRKLRNLIVKETLKRVISHSDDDGDLRHDAIDELADELAHFGVPGMRWGVRRRLGEDGLVRGTVDDAIKKGQIPKAGRKLDKAVKKGKVSEDHAKAMQNLQKDVASLSTADIKQITQRLKAINEFNAQTAAQKEAKRSVLSKISRWAAGAAVAGAKKKGESYIEEVLGDGLEMLTQTKLLPTDAGKKRADLRVKEQEARDAKKKAKAESKTEKSEKRDRKREKANANFRAGRDANVPPRSGPTTEEFIRPNRTDDASPSERRLAIEQLTYNITSLPEKDKED